MHYEELLQALIKFDAASLWSKGIQMRVLRVSKKTNKTKLTIGILSVVSIAVVITGGILAYPIMMGAGVAGCIFLCGTMIAMGQTRMQNVYLA